MTTKSAESDEDWYIPYNGPYEAPREPPTERRDPLEQGERVPVPPVPRDDELLRETAVRRAVGRIDAQRESDVHDPDRARRAEAAPRLSSVPLVWVQSRGNRDGRPILPLRDLEAMGYRGCIDAQILLGAALHAMKRALAELIETGNYTGISDAEFTALRKEIEDLIGLDAYYRVEAETVEPGSAAAPR